MVYDGYFHILCIYVRVYPVSGNRVLYLYAYNNIYYITLNIVTGRRSNGDTYIFPADIIRSFAYYVYYMVILSSSSYIYTHIIIIIISTCGFLLPVCVEFTIIF